MGSWSVYCELSGIAITAGEPCALLPLARPDPGNEVTQPWMPLCPPLIGRYDDYGGIEKVQHSKTCALLEDHFKAPLKELLRGLTRGKYDDRASLESLKEVKYTWLHGEVWEAMSGRRSPGFQMAGSFDMGKHFFLTAAGATFVRKQDGYSQVYSLNGHELHSDGTWVQGSKGESIYSVDDLMKRTGADLRRFKEMYQTDLWQVNADPQWRKLNIMPAFGMSHTTLVFDAFDIRDQVRAEAEALPEPSRSQILESIGPRKDRDGSFKWRLMRELGDDEVCAEAAQVCAMVRNLHCMSGRLRPMTSYVTPQCGEHLEHQWFLDEFADINRRIAKKHNDDEE